MNFVKDSKSEINSQITSSAGNGRVSPEEMQQAVVDGTQGSPSDTSKTKADLIGDELNKDYEDESK